MTRPAAGHSEAPSSGIAARPVTGRIKGAAFREFLSFYSLRYGEVSLADVTAKMDPEFHEYVDTSRPVLGVLASEWYPAAVVHSILDALTGHLSGEERTALADAGSRAIMNRMLRGVYKTLFQLMATPRRYQRFGPKLWDAYYDTGIFRVQMPDDLTSVCIITNWAAHHPFICDLNCAAAAPVYEMMGCKGVRVLRTECVSQGSKHCEFVTSWTARK
jgi:hypothetical protein